MKPDRGTPLLKGGHYQDPKHLDLNAFCNTARLRGILETEDYSMLDIAFPFLAASIYRVVVVEEITPMMRIDFTYYQ